MRRRDFLKGAAASPFLARAPKLRAQEPAPQPPAYQIVTPHKPSGNMGMPGLYPGRAVEVHSPASIDPATDRVGRDALARMVERGMTSLTGEKTAEAAWRKFFSAGDVVGLKINASGAPGCVSSPELVNEIIAGLRLAGVRPSNIYLYERYSQQVDLVGYQAWVPDGVQVVGAEFRSGDPSRYDSGVYVETNFFGEENRRSYMVRLVSQRFTKIVNIPNLKDHSASGVTGCLKNIAYGSFSNVARSHRNYQTHTRTFIGRLCTVEPLRSRTVLHVMDGLRGVWHGGPFAPNRRFLWHPQLLYFGTDPVAIDRLELEVVEAKRRREGGVSLWNRDRENLGDDRSGWQEDARKNRFIREPGHIEFAGGLGLGVYDREKIQTTKVEV